jgi:signal transduction histidine kinase
MNRTVSVPPELRTATAVDDPEFAGLMLARTRTVLWISLVGGLWFMSLELVATPPQIAAPFFVKCAGVILIVISFVLLRQPWALRHAQAMGIVLVAGGYLITALSGILSPSREYATTALLFVGAALTTGVLLPWGVWSQLVTVLVGAAALWVAVVHAGADLPLLPSDPEAAVLIAFVLSLATAREVQRYRLASLRELAARRQAESEVRTVNAGLERRVAERTAELQAANEQLRALSARLQSVREDERAAVAREIHDELGQLLTALKFGVDLLPSRIESERDEPTSQSLRDELNDISQQAATMIHSVRRICAELRPSLLDDLGLAAAIEWQAHEFELRWNIRCTFVQEPGSIEIDPGCSTALFRIVQEALTNVARHANATHVRILLRDDGDAVTLEVDDDGRGVTEAELHDPTSLGLLGIRERARLLGGDVEIRAVRERGTIVCVRIPRPASPPAVAETHAGGQGYVSAVRT